MSASLEQQKVEQLTAHILASDRPLVVARSMAAAFPIPKRRLHRPVVGNSVAAPHETGDALVDGAGSDSSPPSHRIDQPLSEPTPDSRLPT